HLSSQYPEVRFSLVVGADILEDAHKWYGFDGVKKLAEVLVVGRTGYPPPSNAPVMPEVSSTKIRARLAKGEDVSDLVPASVLAYIDEHELYCVRESKQ
ncbi:MAG: nicotinate-nicotinamide nucleotide adenylyltransferase, partial [Pseudomonadota bacterium]